MRHLCDKKRVTVSRQAQQAQKKSHRLRHLCSGCCTQIAIATPVQWIRSSFNINTCQNHSLRHLCSAFWSKNTICDTCASDFGSTCFMFMPKSLFATPVQRILVQNHCVPHLCIGLRTICDTGGGGAASRLSHARFW